MRGTTGVRLSGCPCGEGGCPCLLDDVLELQHGHAHQAVVARKAVVLDTDVQLEEVQLLLVADHAETRQELLVLVWQIYQSLMNVSYPEQIIT